MIKFLQNIMGRPLDKGSVAPSFTLPDQHGKMRSLKDCRGRWVVVFFYPKDDSPLCTQEACSFRDESALFRKRDIEIFGISPDDVTSHSAFAEKHNLNYPLLSDTTLETCEAYGVLLPLKIVNRSTFIIDPRGNIADRLDWVNWFQYGEKVLERMDLLSAKGATP